MSTFAVFLLIGGGTAVAVSKLATNSVGSKQLKKNSVTAVKIKNGAVTGAKVKSGSLTGTQVDASTLGTVPNADSATNSEKLDGLSAADSTKGVLNLGTNVGADQHQFTDSLYGAPGSGHLDKTVVLDGVTPPEEFNANGESAYYCAYSLVR